MLLYACVRAQACMRAHGQGLTLPGRAFHEQLTHWANEEVPELRLCSHFLDHLIPRIFARRAQLSSLNLIEAVRAELGSGWGVIIVHRGWC